MCPKFHKAIRAYTEGRIQGEPKRRLELHLSLCEGCLEEYTRITGPRVEQPLFGWETDPVSVYRRRFDRDAAPGTPTWSRPSMVFGAAGGLYFVYLLATGSFTSLVAEGADVLSSCVRWLKDFVR